MEDKKDYVDDFLLEKIEQYPESIDLVNLLATYYAEVENYDEAIKWFEKSLELRPGNESVIKEIEKLKAK